VQSKRIRWSAMLVMVLVFCGNGIADAQQPVAAATVDGVTITLSEVDQSIAASVAALKERIFQLRQQRLDGLIAEQLLAKEAARRGISIAQLLDSEVNAQAAPIPDEQIAQFYESNKARLPALDAALRDRIRAHLTEEAAEKRRTAFVTRLRAQANIAIHLQAPPVYRTELNLAGAPSKGAGDALVTLVKFEDFHCPFCKEAQRTLAELAARYGDRLRVVHKDYPIDALHPQARLAHLAARCAHEQGKFWPYHDGLYAGSPNATVEDLKNLARQAGLELPSFEACLSNGKYAAAVENDIDEGTKAGVTGTPAFFINGRLLGGAQPLEQFVRIIEEELARVRR